ncbi:nitrilase-related carbon-nitrogen hydrolase [Leptospira licerasiae]|uniref:Hydrolase, carbon-nitrogen family n=1 Tax=Leptospira licerasiae str. MMD4847 TaxID=1049971 RepID=A0ABN0HBS1_9LEPT|nr:nitrilase-related carbon-nitrogen hydrolase [Leptospira licerasiae]EIE03163.1 hydrolase, carbon-nitrogen family [Leptospira licerasiae serovar Varillal str. VAR 010]EJZ43106.1 hydrolase, carbon-nitrogen family [Leptospira licerasiae str. MMD4847]
MRKYIFGSILSIVCMYSIWAYSFLGNSSDKIVLGISSYSYGKDFGKGNLIGVEPFMTPGDYSNRKRFLEKTESYLINAKQSGWINDKTIFVFPEYYGTWLVVSGEKSSLYTSPDLQSGMIYFILRNPFSFLFHLFTSKENDKIQASIFKIKADDMKKIYESSFSFLAQKYGVTILAGSIVLPSPSVENGKIVLDASSLFNTSFVFGKDGSVLGEPVRKKFLTEEEKPFLDSNIKPGTVINTPAGKMGILVCADSWYPESYSNLKELGADFIAVPSYVNRGELSVWDQAWAGYNGEKNPSDVDPGDIGKITEGQAWKKYALETRAVRSGFKNGINVFLQGKLWDLESDGKASILRNGKPEIVSIPEYNKNRIYNLWL